MRKTGFSLVCSSFFVVFICEHYFLFTLVGLKSGCIVVCILGEASILQFNTCSDDEIIVFQINLLDIVMEVITFIF
jgi:hypothetical protein